jgi:predicted GNAT family acetyltransferase
MSLEVRRDEAGRRFVAVIDGHEAYVKYRPADDKTLNFHHTYVPDELRGRGIAGKLVARALDLAREQGLAVIPTCSYVQGFLERHPEYQDLTTS